MPATWSWTLGSTAVQLLPVENPRQLLSVTPYAARRTAYAPADFFIPPASIRVNSLTAKAPHQVCIAFYARS